jgi:hypothetical protein
MVHLKKILTLIGLFMLISICFSQDEVNYFNPNNIVTVPAGQLGISRVTGPVYFDFAEIDNNNLTISAGTSVFRVYRRHIIGTEAGHIIMEMGRFPARILFTLMNQVTRT